MDNITQTERETKVIEALLDAAQIALELIEGGHIYEQQCCGGHMCACQGATYADEATHFLRKAIALATLTGEAA